MSKNQNKMVTIVCCYNDSRQYQKFCTSLENQNVAYELVGIDNRAQQFSSCSSALNAAISSVNTEYVIYSHQDIELPEPDMLERFLAYLGQTGENDIVGVAGAVDAAAAAEQGRQIPEDVREGTYVVSNVRHGDEMEKAGETDFSGMQSCDSVDECFFGGHTAFFQEYPFDEELCDNWHLYAVDRCLFTRMRGNRVYVCDIPLLHYSSGKINHLYNRNFYRIAQRYARGRNTKRDAGRRGTEDGRAEGFAWIRTVCGSAGTDWLRRTLFYLKREALIRMGRF